MSLLSNLKTRMQLLVAAAVVAIVAAVSFPAVAFAQSSPISELQTAAVGAATDATGLVVAVVIITLAIVFGLWAIRKARSG